MDFSNLYLDLQKGRKLSFKTFMVWVTKSIYQGSMIIILTILIFNESFITNIVTVSFTSLIFIELLNIITTVKKIKCKIVTSVLLSLICYIISILLFKDYINTSAITGIFILKVIAITAATWLPPFILIKISDCIYPDPLKKMENR